jgi:hypothetical protein
VVAETHSHGDADFGAALRFVVEDLGGLELGATHEERASVTLADCGFDTTLGIVELLGLLADELGERSLADDELDLDEVDGATTVESLLASAYPALRRS